MPGPAGSLPGRRQLCRVSSGCTTKFILEETEQLSDWRPTVDGDRNTPNCFGIKQPSRRSDGSNRNTFNAKTENPGSGKLCVECGLPRSKTRSTLPHQLQVSALSRSSLCFCSNPWFVSHCLTCRKTRQSILGWLSTVENALRPMRWSRTAFTETSIPLYASLSHEDRSCNDQIYQTRDVREKNTRIDQEWKEKESKLDKSCVESTAVREQ